VTIIVPFAPGGPSDIIGRLTAQHMQQASGRPFAVENRPGATGEIGAPDGHTLMHAPISTWAINVALRPNLGYDPVRELTRITQAVRTPNVLLANPQAVPANDLPGVIEWLTRNAATASYPASGIGSSDHLTAEMFKQATGTEMACILYSGCGPAMTSAIAGTTQLSFQNLGAVIPRIQSGRLRAIMITSDARSPVLPNVPTAVESVLRDFVVCSWQAYDGPPGMAPDLVRAAHGAIVAALKQPETNSAWSRRASTWSATAPRNSPPSRKPRSPAGGGWCRPGTSDRNSDDKSSHSKEEDPCPCTSHAAPR
jgi:tripartite-type tricarboxylate transporter receptor subunit TctC